MKSHTIMNSSSLISQLIYCFWNDPEKFSVEYGGKDGVPFPIKGNTFDSSITFLTEAIERGEISWVEKSSALKRLSANLKIIFPGHSE